MNYKLSGVLLLSFLALAIASAQMVIIGGSPGAPVVEDSFDPGDPIVWDGFEYDVAVDEAGGIGNTGGSAYLTFTSDGPWTSVKRLPTDTGAHGQLYTTTTPAPPHGTRSLVAAGLAETGSSQTDFYVRYDGGSVGAINGDYWQSFWWRHTAASEFSARDKFIYPCRNANPGSCPETDVVWLISPGRNGNECIRPGIDQPTCEAALPVDEVYFSIRQYYGTGFAGGSSDNETKLYYNLEASGSQTALLPDTWYFLKWHVDTSGAQGDVEFWIHELGDESPTQVMGWYGGVTTDYDFAVPTEFRTGTRWVSMPTTEPGSGADMDFRDNQKFLDGIAIANAESDLPTYVINGITYH